MALVTLPLLSGNASGSVAHSLTFVRHPVNKIVRSYARTSGRPKYPTVLKPSLFPALSYAITAIIGQSARVVGKSKCYNAILTSIGPNVHVPSYLLSILSKYFKAFADIQTYTGHLISMDTWRTCAALLPINQLSAIEYENEVPPYVLFALQAYLLFLLQPWAHGVKDWISSNPITWDDEIIAFLNTQLYHS